MVTSCIFIAAILAIKVSLVSSVPRLLVNNTGSDATGTDVYPQHGAPLEVWCWTENDPTTTSRLWYNSGGKVKQYATDSDATNEDVYAIRYSNITYIKILKFRSYNYSQAGRHDCKITFEVADTEVLSIYIGTPPKVKGVTVMVSGSFTSPMISVSWTAVDSPSSVAYTVYYSTSTQPPPGSVSSVQNITGTSLTLTSSHGLQTGTTYYIWVSAVTTSGQLEGPISNRECASLHVAAPVPESVSVVSTPSEGTLRVTWTRPTVSDGSTITSYSIQYKRSNEMTYSNKTVNGGDTTSSDITGLDLSTQYSVRIASVNELGTGDYSGIVSATTYGYAPPPPSVSASPQTERGKIAVSWTPPTPPPGSSLTGYSIQYRMGGSGSYMTVSDPGGSATSTIVSNLQVGTQYQVRVAAKTELGVGPNSYGTTQVTTFNVPGPVSGLTYNVISASSVNISWSEPDEPNGVIVGYSVRYREFEGNADTEILVESLHLTITGLMRYIPYKVTVSARTSVGEGEPSSVVFFTLEGVPTAPLTDVDVVALGDGSVRARWTPLSLVEARGFPLYIVSYSSDDGAVLRSVNTTNSSVIITGLNPNIGYSFTVQVATGSGNGPATTKYLKGTLPSPSSDTTAVTVGAFIGGAIFGAVTIVLVAGIVFGVFRLRRNTCNRNTKQESQQDSTYEEVGTERTVHHDTNFIMMEKNVAYDSVDFKA